MRVGGIGHRLDGGNTMKTVITYGTYDMLHYGHIALLKRAKALGDYLIVGVTSDSFDRNRGKLNVRQSCVERVMGVINCGIADEVIIEEYQGQKIDDIKKYHVDVFTVGSDWTGYFDYLNDCCEVTYLPRTEGVSSTQLRAEAHPLVRVGILGTGGPINRFVEESKFVSGIEVVAACQDDSQELADFTRRHDIEACASAEELLEMSDAVYICSRVDRHAEDVMNALRAGKHVIVESPAFMSAAEAQGAFSFAHQQGLVLFEALKTVYFPAFEHLQVLIGSGAIGAIRDINLACSKNPENFDLVKKDPYLGAMYDWGAIATMPMIRFLGGDCKQLSLKSFDEDGFNCMVKGDMIFENATASFRVGTGMKTEGDLVITGTDGYVYVPSPWWKTEYFEVRGENLSDTRKYFYKFQGEGLRYEILEFLQIINNGAVENYKRPASEVIAGARIVEQFAKGDVISIEQ